MPYVETIVSPISMIDSFSPWPRVMSARLPYSPAQLKHSTGLPLLVCCGYRTAKLYSSASVSQPADSIDDAVCVQPCITTTSGEPLGKLAGTCTYICSPPGFEPKLVTGVWAAYAGAAKASVSNVGTTIRMLAALCIRRAPTRATY